MESIEKIKKIALRGKFEHNRETGRLGCIAKLLIWEMLVNNFY
jgi:hypothetical protein